jgi:DNA-binding CsgD family transcriptional regulator
MPSDDSFERLIDVIYEAAVVPELWRGVVDRLGEISGMKGGLIAVFMAGPQQDVRWVASDSLIPLLTVFVREGWVARNTRAAKLALMQYPGFVTDLDLFTREEMDKDPFYTELLRPLGLGWGAGTLIPVSTGDTLVFTVEGDSGPVKRQAMKMLNSLRPHLARAGLLSARLRLAHAQTTAEVLRSVGLPAAVLQNNGVVLAANDLLEQLGAIVFRAQDRIALSNPSADALLLQAMSRLGTAASNCAVCSIPVPATDEQPAMIIHLMPAKGAAQDVLWGGLAVLLVTKVTAPGAVPADLLHGLFDLTPSEARVAALIGAGLAPCAVAAKLDITEQTVRTALKQVFTKVGVSRQSELVALLTNLALR